MSMTLTKKPTTGDTVVRFRNLRTSDTFRMRDKYPGCVFIRTLTDDAINIVGGAAATIVCDDPVVRVNVTAEWSDHVPTD